MEICSERTCDENSCMPYVSDLCFQWGKIATIFHCWRNETDLGKATIAVEMLLNGKDAQDGTSPYDCEWFVYSIKFNKNQRKKRMGKQFGSDFI